MDKKISFHVWLILSSSALAFMLSSCGEAMSTSTPTSPTPSTVATTQWQPMPTHSYYVPPSDMTEYIHYTPSEAFNFNLEFDYPSYWWLQEYSDEAGILDVFLGDPRILTLPPPSDNGMHPTPNDFGSVYIWIMPSEPGQTPETELESHKKSYSEIHRMKVFGDYKITIAGNDANVLEYQVDDPETSPSLMFYRRTYFMVNDQVYEIIYSVAEKDRGGEFDKGYEYFLNSLKILP